ncbi:MAG: ATP-dependent helicase HrpB [Deltaproteobacteria bacterium]|nr:ATP-dependent helicase HrpB [Deltaproteobacteria bacterium]
MTTLVSRPALPIDAVLPDVVRALRAAPAVVVQAPPGAGKTTRLPLALLHAGLLDARGAAGGGGRLLLLEPRRIAARAAATTMSRALDEPVGRTVGYQVRFDRKESRDTRILVVTEGILTRRFADDPFLEGASAVVLDEFHERSVHTDLCLALLKELATVRDDLKIVVMSATLDAGAVATFLHDCPVVTSAGRPHPVTVRHSDRRARDVERPLDERVAGALRTVFATATSDRAFVDDGGDVLVFLPGTAEIRRVQERLAADPLPGAPDVVPLSGQLSAAEQDRALLAGPRRRVVLATNVAETSLTLEGVTAVVDSGLMKSARWDPRSDRERLELGRISRASAEQRAGRAGRTRPGRALRLWTEAEHAGLSPNHAPEIHRVELSRVLLDVALFTQSDPRRFAWFEAPPAAHVHHALRLLQLLGALDDAGRPTPRGRALARLPVSPRAAAVLLDAAAKDVVEDASVAMALLEDDRALQQLQPRGTTTATDSDLQVLLGRAHDDRRLREVHQSARELARLLDEVDVSAPTRGAVDEPPARRLTRALLAGFPDRVCRRRRAGEPDAVMVGGRGVRLGPDSGVVAAPLFLALSLEGTGAASLVRVAEAVDEALLRDVFPGALVTRDEAVFDDDRGAFAGVRRTRFADLVLVEKPGVAVDDAALAAGLAEHCARQFTRVFRPDDAALRLRERLLFAARFVPEEPWPAVDDDALCARLPELCAELVARGRRRVEDVTALDWHAVLDGQLTWAQRQLLDEEVPARLAVPTGNRLAVDYAPALAEQGGPVLAVRLQECFGWTTTPTVARSRVPVVLHLLSPGYKPVQVTRDLHSFWRSGYPEVKKELKARYPKHAWPDDPLAAAPVAKGRSTR